MLNKGSYESNVFINCPFDDAYRPLLKALLFTIKSCGLHPRIASERLDAYEARVEKIIELIAESKYSIHDLSRIKSAGTDEYYRLNMPFEIGLDLGCKKFHPDEKYRSKFSLILEKERFSLHKALSDLSSSDVKCHNEDAEQLVEEVRTWFSETGLSNLPGPSLVWDNFNIFNADLYARKVREGFKPLQIDKLPVPEFLKAVDKWLQVR